MVFEPFFSSKPRGEGSGLGLAISKQIVDSFGGRIEISSEVGRGTVVTITLPEAHALPGPEVITPVHRVAEVGRPARILVVDDEQAIATALRRSLSDHQIKSVTGTREALRILLDDGGFDVILCDLMMPDLPGSELFQRVCEIWPGLRSRFVFMTGGAFVPAQAAFLESSGCRVLAKPFDPLQLEQCVREVANQNRAS
jgi:CheY-like chemotaxis protein